jgi:mono/diheme cytochrome c family protein
MRSPEQEARLVASHYNRYCVRCHGHDGRGVCDIPDVPDFTCASWQASRSDPQLTRLTLEGRGAVMPAFRGTLSLEEAAALARYVRRFGQPPVEEIIPPHRLPEVQSDSASTASAP